MKLIHALIIALIASCCILGSVPATAANGNHYTGLDANAGESKYVDPPLSESEQISQTSGTIGIAVSTGGCLPEWARAVTVASYNGSFVQHVDIGMDGREDIRVPPNTYAVCYATDHGSSYDPSTWRMTCQDAEISPAGLTTITFIGPGSSCEGVGIGECRIEIVSAEYGDIDCEEVCHEEIDVPAHDEYRVRGYWDYFMTPWGLIHVWHHATFWSAWSDDQYPHWNEIPAWDKQTRHVDATYTDVCEEVCTGSYVDVTAQVQDVIAHGHKSFVFDNSKSPGGIFDVAGETLLAEIADPAPDQVKSVAITYLKCGQQNTVTGNEYEVINLN